MAVLPVDRSCSADSDTGLGEDTGLKPRVGLRMDQPGLRVASPDKGSPRPQPDSTSPRAASLIAFQDLRRQDLDAWRALAAEAVEPNPFFEPECVLPAARQLGESNIALLVVEGREHKWLACMPVSPRLRVRQAYVPAVLSAWRHVHAFLSTPLVARSDVDVAVGRLIEGALRASRFGTIALPRIGADGPVFSALLAALQERRRRPVAVGEGERAVIGRSALAGGVDAMVSSRHRRDLRRLERRLTERLGGPLELRDESEREAAVDDFIALEASGWKAKAGTAIASQPGHAEFFRQLCDGFRAAGRLQLLALGSADRVVSYKLNLLAGDAVFCHKVAFDESFARYRPGLQLELRMLGVFRDRMSQAWMDSCSDPGSELFERLWPGRRRIGWYVIAANRAAGWCMQRGAGRLAARARAGVA